MKEEVYGVITFKSTHYAIMGETVLEENNIGFKTIPTPREITYSCGLALLFILDDLSVVENLIENKELEIDNVYKYTKGSVNKAEKLI